MATGTKCPCCLQAFYESQQSTTRGFMRMAVSTLAMLNTLVENAAVREGFMHESVVNKAAAAVSSPGLLTGAAWAGSSGWQRVRMPATG